MWIKNKINRKNEKYKEKYAVYSNGYLWWIKSINLLITLEVKMLRAKIF